MGSLYGGANYNLGIYSESWTPAVYLNQSALSVQYVGGSPCGDFGSRNSTVYLLCDRVVVYDAVQLYEDLNCSYTFAIYTSDASLCDFLSPGDRHIVYTQFKV